MDERHSRTAALLGEDAPNILKGKHVAVFGLGGVGSYLVEALARAGVGALTLIDKDIYTESNLNRQLYALPETVGKRKTQVAAARVTAIDPSIAVKTVDAFVLPESVASLPLDGVDYIADAIDTVSAKIALAVFAKEKGISMISAMGAGNKLDSTAFRVARIDKTRVCPLARVMRTELKKRGISGGATKKFTDRRRKRQADPRLCQFRSLSRRTYYGRRDHKRPFKIRRKEIFYEEDWFISPLFLPLPYPLSWTDPDEHACLARRSIGGRFTCIFDHCASFYVRFSLFRRPSLDHF